MSARTFDNFPSANGTKGDLRKKISGPNKERQGYR